jgi:hypothetical protein
MLIYLASPYTDPDPAVMEARALEACRVACGLLAQGHRVIAPIAFYHLIAKVGCLPPEFEFWDQLDEQLILVCGELWIIAMLGWKSSRGINNEVIKARRWGKPIYLVDPETLKKESL